MSKHTPLPWEVETPMGDDTPWIVETGKEAYEWRMIAMTASSGDGNESEDDPPVSRTEAMANAEFIVLACNTHDDLVKALERIADECRAAHEMVGKPLGKGSWAALEKIALAALAKARGEQP